MIRDALGRLGAEDRNAAPPSCQISARLLTIGGVPVPSLSLPVDFDGRGAAVTPAAASWLVESLSYEMPAAGAMLSRLAGSGEDASVILGDDLRLWVVAARFGFELLYRQRVLPTVQRERDGYAARWRPVLDEADTGRLRTLARAMPPACHALGVRPDAPAPHASERLRDFLDHLVDAEARAALRDTPGAGRPPPMRAKSKRPLGDVWLEALGGAPALVGTPAALQAFTDEYRAWAHVPAAPADADTFRLCLRLDPPEHGQAWRLRFLLQATDDLSLLVPAAQVWRQRGATARFLNRRFDNPQERFLTDLGRAARLFPPIETGLHTARPEECRLTTLQAYTFVRDSALVLRASGIGVLLPGLDTRLTVRARLGRSRSGSGKSATSTGIFTWDAMVAFDWQLALGGERLTREEFEQLARLKEPLVQIRGQWVELRPELLEQALAFFRGQPGDGELSLAEAIRLALVPDGNAGLPIERVETEGWFDDLLHDLRGGPCEAITGPPGFVGRLRPYQQGGVAWLATLRRYGLGACLADDMGLGKTPTAIGLLLYERSRQGSPEEPGPALIICPTSVVGNWQREIARFAPSLRVLVHHGADRSRATFAAEVARHDVVISTYALLHRDEEALTAVQWGDVILDEAQNIKNASTRAAQTARRLSARWRAALTGTPVENRLSDLWSIFQFLNPGYLGSHEDFRRRFAHPIERDHHPDATARLQALVSPFILRRLKTDRTIIDDLPAKNEMKVFTPLTREQATLYEAVLREQLQQIGEAEGVQRRGQILATLLKLKQVCNHPALFLHDAGRLDGRSGKLTRMTEMLEEILSVDERALVFTQFSEMGAMLKAYLEAGFGGEALFLHGGTPAAARDRMVTRFQEDVRGPGIFILSIKAGGAGLNLTRANHVFHFDRWWNPAVENQATDRAFRIGQGRDVQVHKFICGGTFEEQLDQMIERKLALSESIVGAGETWITEMSTEQLRELFALRGDAVAEE